MEVGKQSNICRPEREIPQPSLSVNIITLALDRVRPPELGLDLDAEPFSFGRGGRKSSQSSWGDRERRGWR